MCRVAEIVPIIGEPYTVVSWWPTTIMNCRCQKNRVQLVIITGFGNAAACGGCGKLYLNNRINAATGQIEVVVMLPQDPNAQVQ